MQHTGIGHPEGKRAELQVGAVCIPYHRAIDPTDTHTVTYIIHTSWTNGMARGTHTNTQHLCIYTHIFTKVVNSYLQIGAVRDDVEEVEGVGALGLDRLGEVVLGDFLCVCFIDGDVGLFVSSILSVSPIPVSCGTVGRGYVSAHHARAHTHPKFSKARDAP